MAVQSAFAQGEVLMFMENMQPLCGKTFSGRMVYPEGEAKPYSNNPLTMVVAVCTDDTIKIPFHVGSDRSRTWVLTLTSDGLLFKHDVKDEDGSPEEVTGFGGLATEESTAWEVHFPSDEETIEMLPQTETNVWSLVIDRDAKIFRYILSREGKKLYQFDFDIDLGIESGL